MSNSNALPTNSRVNESPKGLDAGADELAPLRRWRRLGWAWLIASLLMLAALLSLLPTARINSSVMALLPQDEMPGVDPQWQEQLSTRLDRQLVWLVSLPKGQTGEQAATWWYQALQQLPELQQVKGPDQVDPRAWQQFLQDYRYQRLDPVSQTRLQQGAERWSQWVLSQIYSPFAGVSPREWQQDPLLLTRSAVQGQVTGPLRLKQGWLVSQDEEGRSWFLLRAELQGSAFDLNSGRSLVARLQQLETQLQGHYPGSQILSRGTLYYSDHAAALAKADISTIGLGSLLGILLLIWWVFRGLRPLWLCMLPLAVGMVSGLLAVLLCFGQIHLFTLVISSSLIGISDDYSLHYLSERRLHGHEESPLATALRLRQPLLLALVTTLFAYMLLWLAPFPGLQQMAVFSLAGLIGSFVTVFCWFPFLVGNMTQRPVPGRALMLGWLRLWQYSNRLRMGLPLVLLALAAIGLSRLVVDDDIRRLQPLPQELQAEEQQVSRLTGQGSQLTGFLVLGADAEQALQRAEALSQVLTRLKQQKVIGEFRNPVASLPSRASQQATHSALSALQPQVIARLQQAGLVIENRVPPLHVLTPEAWLHNPVSEGLRLLWLSDVQGRVAILMPVSEVHDLVSLQRATRGLSGVHWQDKRQSWSDLFARYRWLLGLFLALGVTLTAGLLWYKLGREMTLRLLVGNGIAMALATAALGFCGLPFTLFSLLALSLVFGIGVDYGLFFAHASQEHDLGRHPAQQERLVATLLAVLLANLTTQLAFGLLALSHTQAIASFGLVLSVGVFVSFLLAPLVMPAASRKELPHDA
jgi:predicted exporter